MKRLTIGLLVVILALSLVSCDKVSSGEVPDPNTNPYPNANPHTNTDPYPDTHPHANAYTDTRSFRNRTRQFFNLVRA